MATPSIEYRGRFAPSPTGELHFGSLVAALGSYLDARTHDGEWLVRMEDLDQTRAVPKADSAILRTLEQLGFEWDHSVLYQSARNEAYQNAFERLRRNGLVYACTCSRQEIAEAGEAGIEGPVYPGTCRLGSQHRAKHPAYRVLTNNETIEVFDRLQGTLAQNLEREIGDFVLRRADDFFAYQLAVVVDDAEQGITDVVRGADLLLSTPRQCYLQDLLGIRRPRYAHLPLATDREGRKLSKQAADLPVDTRHGAEALRQALAFLGQPIPSEPLDDCPEMLAWALAHWSMENVPKVPARIYTSAIEGPLHRPHLGSQD